MKQDHQHLLESAGAGAGPSLALAGGPRGPGAGAGPQPRPGQRRDHPAQPLPPGADTASFGGKAHDVPEEILIVIGRLYDEAFAIWLEPGHYASRPPGEVHGPFRSDGGCLVLDISFPQRNKRVSE